MEALRAAFGDCLTDRDLVTMSAVAQEWEAEPHEQLVSEGSSSPQGFVLIDGRATAYVAGVAVARLGPGSCVWGDAPDGLPRPASIVTDSAAWVLVLPPRELGVLRRRLAAAARPVRPGRRDVSE